MRVVGDAVEADDDVVGGQVAGGRDDHELSVDAQRAGAPAVTAARRVDVQRCLLYTSDAADE